MKNKARTFWWGFAGTFWGLFIAFGSLIVGGAGDGWVSPLPFGILAILTTPLASIAWARKRTDGRKLAAFCLVIAMVANIVLFFATLAEGIHYFVYAFPYAIVWLVLWSSWQLLALIVVFYKPAISRA